MRKISVLVVTLGVACLQAEAEDTPSRLDRIQRLLNQAQSELDSLREESPRLSPLPQGSQTAEPPIAEDLFTERQKKLIMASRTSYRLSAAGYSFNPNFQGMNFIQWFGDWGGKIDAGAEFTPNDREANMNLSALRSLNRFSFLRGGFETHLYAFTGAGLCWRKQESWTSFDWYTKPDLIGRWQLGAGTELNFGFFGGIKFAPEVGLQASDYLQRYQDSPEWSPSYYEVLPKSDFSLDAYYAFHLNFYFR